MAEISLKSIKELEGYSFYIPNYQRGYRWTEQQVTDLLTDIYSFEVKEDKSFYCIQPLVVKNKEDKWEVIDGQQRLTTIHLLLSDLEHEEPSFHKYSLEYETRQNSKDFLNDIQNKKEDEANDNVDFFYMFRAFKVMKDWFDSQSFSKKDFKDKLLNHVKFIEYESDDEDSIQVFTRLNVGKISLTSSELIKAILLNKSNFKKEDYSQIHLQQQSIANEWDRIETTLQNDEFWLFLHEKKYSNPTRIDFILDLMRETNQLNLLETDITNVGKDEYCTFRYFYTYINNQKKENSFDVVVLWSQIKSIFQIFEEWFNNLELFHYIGYLIELKSISIESLLSEYKKDNKSVFLDFLKKEISKSLKGFTDLEKEYEGTTKTKYRPLLLLFNIQTVINQNSEYEKEENYKLPVFYKFPFHLFKKERWDVEHIDSFTSNGLEDTKEQKEWLKAASFELKNENLKKSIIDFIKKDKPDNFKDLQEQVIQDLSLNASEDKLSDEDKNKLWNYCLLDSSTNRSYGNAIFSAKRRVIIGKDRGILIFIDDDLKIQEQKVTIAFIPPCTKNAFLKYFNPSANNLRAWDTEDASSYLANIKSVLHDFLPTQTK